MWSMVWSTESPALTMSMTRRGRLRRLASSSDGVGADDVGALGFVGEEVVDLGGGAVEDGDFEAVVVHVEDEILSHDGKADEADITRCVWHKPSEGTLILAPGKTVISGSEAVDPRDHPRGFGVPSSGSFWNLPGCGTLVEPLQRSIHLNF
jgi:hypothetical protein